MKDYLEYSRRSKRSYTDDTPGRAAAHLSPDHIKAAVERLAASNSGRATGTKTGTVATGKNEERAASA